MSVEILRPWALLGIPLCAAVILLFALLRKSRSRKERVSHALRYVLTVLVVLALSGVSVLTVSPDRGAFLVVDVSASMEESHALALAREALSAAGADRKTGVIVYGADAAVERSLGQSGPLQSVESRVSRGASNLGQALQLASALLPADMNGGIAVISDGLVDMTDQDLRAVQGIPVNALKTDSRTGSDAQVTSVSVPASLYTGQKYTTLVTVHASEAGQATLVLTRNHQPEQTRTVTLRKGENTFAFESVAEAAGVIPCEARVMMAGDTVAANDVNGAFTDVAGEISVLLVEGKSGEGAALQRMLQAAGMRVRTVPAAMLPEAASELWAYQAVALVNVDAETLSAGQIAALDAAARELGVGVAVFGGDSSYALGGYRGSDLEKMLPVTIDVKNKMDLPTTALVLVIDKSGSMAEASFGVSRLALAREAASSALELLNERDFAGVIAFDDEGKWVVPLSQVTDVQAMQDQVGTIRLGGGTAFYSPLVMALNALRGVQAQYRHVIFLTDGESGDTGYEAVAAEMAAQGITLTTVAVGDGADAAGLRKLAELGNGRMYVAGPFDSLPRIFTRETMRISGAYVQNRVFTPVITSPEMTDFEGFPPLSGYLAATEKPLATVSLVSDRRDPILSWWQYGAGRVAAWCSDVQGGWSESFLAWDQAAEFFGGVIAFILPEATREGRLTFREGVLRYEADFPEAADQADAEVTFPDGTKQRVALERVSPTAFEARLDADEIGAYTAEAAARDRQEDVLLSARGGGVVSWTREYDQRIREEGALETLTEAAGGQMAQTPADLMAFPDTQARKRKDLTPLLLCLAAALFLFDVAQRRLDWWKEPVRDQQADKAPPKPAKPTKTPKSKTKEPPQPEAAQVLWQNLQNRKKL